ncbi:unnamed protein product [Durusdinium trenchii]|uniref:Uncharacterized protein n=2 Tax=Durusdinium trenchii TaxID=1381693 RepID=A0ABP0L507_9DINO
MHHFREVCLPVATFVKLPSHVQYLHTFGAVAGLSNCGDEMVVEFYDMCAAHRTANSIPGCRPMMHTPASSSSPLCPAEVLQSAGMPTVAQEASEFKALEGPA